MKGTLIVLEGTDGSGKATQAARLAEQLAREGFSCRKVDFPRYGEPSCAMVETYLAGGFGAHAGDVNAYAASLFYAMDRFAAVRQDWGAFYEQGGIIIADRYTTSNAVHQAPKLPEGERQAYLDWLFDTEYRLLGIPKPDLVLYLDMPPAVSGALLKGRQASTHTSGDIHERDGAYLAASRENGRALAQRLGWHLIDCAISGAPRPIDEIASEVYEAAAAVLPAQEEM